ncbi:hypothetical protein IWX50DRAFT_628431 [Phyllosticta citricarpa]|uniref:Uncharacterized protein n=1 Tax=Phyllosticta citricarpa TaxID=55181 RepID=A0ABR1MN42_9PEZI
MPASNFFRNAKRTLRPYDPLPGGNSYLDDPDEAYGLEKDESDYNDSSVHSSPSTYGSGVMQPMMPQNAPSGYRHRSNSIKRKQSLSAAAAQTASIPFYSNPRIARRRFSRWFALALGGSVIFFIIWLSAMGRRSHLAVETGIAKEPDPPPPWEAFPFLKRYHGGIRTLVNVSDNKPEYPGAGFNASELLQVGGKEGRGLPKKRSETGGEGWSFEDERNRDHGLPPMQVFSPYPAYWSAEYVREYGAEVKTCYLDEKTKQRMPQVRVYPGVVRGSPENVMGSYEIFGLRDDICFERFGRLGPYGWGYSKKHGGSGAGLEGDREGAEQVWQDDDMVDFREVKWAQVQQRCIESNKHRFKPRPNDIGQAENHFYFHGLQEERQEEEEPEAPKLRARDAEAVNAETEEESGATIKPFKPVGMEEGTEEKVAKKPESDSGEAKPFRVVNTGSGEKLRQAKKTLPRTAVIIRTWHDFHYDDEDLFYLRALVTELALNSGGEYEVHFLIHVKDNDLPIWSDEETYQRVLDESLPEEFRGMGTLWTERQMSLIYGGLAESNYRDLPVYGVYRSTYLPMQHFAHMHPEYDFFWHWEMDARYTGHYYHLFDKVSAWAREQPRKGLWERNARFYVPTEHGSWDDFKHMVRVQTEHGTSSKSNIWNQMARNDPNVPDDVKADSAPRADRPIWGPEHPEDDEIDSENDPLPPRTMVEDKYQWGVGEEADLITLNPLFDPDGTNWILAGDVTGYNTTSKLPPRRTAIITASRLSRRLLMQMHRDTSRRRRTMFSEMWPGTTALHHGLKAVYAPHPVFIDRRWPTDFLAATMNGGRNGASGGSRLSVFSDERQHNFRGQTWYYNAGFAPNLWRRWLGYVVDNDGGEHEEVWGEGRMCLRAALVHPVKDVELVTEHREGE